jgi:hypothetical protein
VVRFRYHSDDGIAHLQSGFHTTSKSVYEGRIVWVKRNLVANGHFLWRKRRDYVLVLGMIASVLILNTRQTGTDELVTSNNGVDGDQQLSSGVDLKNVAFRPSGKGSVHNLARIFLAYEKNFVSWAEIANLSSDFYSI